MPYVAQLGACVPPLGPSRPILGTERRPKSLSGRFWSAFGPFREALEALKHWKIYGFCCISRSATDIVQIVQISPWGVPERPPRGAQERPGTPEEAPKTAPRAPQASQERPQGAQTRLPSGLGGQVGPTGTKEPPGGLPKAILDPPRAGFAPSGGSIFGQFSSLGKHRQSCPVGKACASLRPAPLYLLVKLLHMD